VPVGTAIMSDDGSPRRTKSAFAKMHQVDEATAAEVKTALTSLAFR
jgi:hypothetical protein